MDYPLYDAPRDTIVQWLADDVDVRSDLISGLLSTSMEARFRRLLLLALWEARYQCEVEYWLHEFYELVISTTMRPRIVRYRSL